MGLKVIAEGVENDEQYQDLFKTNCDMIQGYYLGSPIPEEDAVKLAVQHFEKKLMQWRLEYILKTYEVGIKSW